MDVKLPEPRQDWLARQLAAGGPVVASEVAAALGVSVDTIRRDIIALEAAGHARRVRGGAVPVKGPDAPMAAKIAGRARPSAALVAAVLMRVEGAKTLLIDGGSTALALAEALPVTPDLLVMTPSPWVAVACNERGIAVHLIGGALPPGGAVATGAESEMALAGLAAEVAVIGACGLDADHGLSADSDGEARLKRAMAASCELVLVPVSAEKLRLRARFRALEPQEIDVVVTDAGSADTAGYEDRGIEVIHV